MGVEQWSSIAAGTTVLQANHTWYQVVLCNQNVQANLKILIFDKTFIVRDFINIRANKQRCVRKTSFQNQGYKKLLEASLLHMKYRKHFLPFSFVTRSTLDLCLPIFCHFNRVITFICQRSPTNSFLECRPNSKNFLIGQFCRAYGRQRRNIQMLKEPHTLQNMLSAMQKLFILAQENRTRHE